jgi:hypothetical protein
MLWFIVRFDPHFRHAVGINSSPDQTEWVKKVLRFIDQNPKFKKQWNRDASEWTLGLKKLFYRDLFATQKNAHQLDMKAACPMKIVANAVMRLISNISACLTNLEKNQEKRRLKPWYRKYRFKIRYRPVKHIQNGVMYIDRDKYRLGEESLSFNKISIPIPVIPQDDHPLARTNEITIQIKNGKFHVCVSYRKVVPTRIEPAPASIVALDPGCRKFLSFFDTDGEAGVIGQGVYHHFKPHLVTMANCQRKIRSAKKAWRSRDRKESHTKREAKRAKRLYRCRILRFSKRYRKHLRRVQNICKDAHYKTAHWLLTNYTHVILPKFNVSFFAKKRSGLSRTTRKAMLQLRELRSSAAPHPKVHRVSGTASLLRRRGLHIKDVHLLWDPERESRLIGALCVFELPPCLRSRY